MSSEVYTYLYEKLLHNKALDVFSTPIFMKKNRPAYKLTVICNLEHKNYLEELILKETTTFGLRSYEVNRTILDRTFTKVNTNFGEVTVKNGFLNEKHIKSSFEFEDVKKLAIEHNVPIQEIIEECIKKC